MSTNSELTVSNDGRKTASATFVFVRMLLALSLRVPHPKYRTLPNPNLGKQTCISG